MKFSLWSHADPDSMSTLLSAAEDRAAYWHNQWQISQELVRGTEEALKLAYTTNAKQTNRLMDLQVRDGHRVVRGLILPDLESTEPGRSEGPTPIFDSLPDAPEVDAIVLAHIAEQVAS